MRRLARAPHFCFPGCGLTSSMTDPAVAAAFAKHQPWITKYDLRGASSGGWFDAPNDPRLGLFRRCFPEARRILELGSLEGGHTIGLGRQPGVERILGIEGRQENYARAQLAKELFAVDNISFVHANLEQIASLDVYVQAQSIHGSGEGIAVDDAFLPRLRTAYGK